MLMLMLALLAAQDARPKPKLVIALRPLTAAEARVIQSAVRDELVDPDSSNFKMLPLSKNSDRYCAYVNAKNRFGGYDGFRAFTVYVTKNPAGQVIEASHPSVENRRDPLMADLKRAVCAGQGYDLPILGPGR